MGSGWLEIYRQWVLLWEWESFFGDKFVCGYSHCNCKCQYWYILNPFLISIGTFLSFALLFRTSTFVHSPPQALNRWRLGMCKQLNSATRECICHIVSKQICHIRSHCVQASHTLTRPLSLGGVPDKFLTFSDIFSPVRYWWFKKKDNIWLKRLLQHNNFWRIPHQDSGYLALTERQKITVSDVEKLGENFLWLMHISNLEDRKFFFCAYSLKPTCFTTIFQFPTLVFHSFGSRAVRNDGCKAFLAAQLGNSAHTFPIPLSPTNISRSRSHSQYWSYFS